MGSSGSAPEQTSRSAEKGSSIQQLHDQVPTSVLEKIQGSTDANNYFEIDEIKLFYLAFTKATGGAETLNKKRFTELFPEVNSEGLINSFFIAIDKDNTDSIEFSEWLGVLGTMCRGSFHEKLELSYNIVDIDDDGNVSRKEFLELIKQLNQILEKTGSNIENFFSPEEIVSKLFDSMTGENLYVIGGSSEDTSHHTESLVSNQGVTHLSKKHFIERAMFHPDVLGCFDIFYDYFYRQVIKPIEAQLKMPELNVDDVIKRTLKKDGYKVNVVLAGNFFGYSREGDSDPREVLFLYDGCVKIQNNTEFIMELPECRPIFQCKDGDECLFMVRNIRAHILGMKNCKNRFHSFANMRPNTDAQWFVRGKAYYKNLYEYLNNAKERIFITDWWFCPDIYLIRDQFPLNPEHRIDNLLKRKAEKDNVKIYVLVWAESSVGFFLGSQQNALRLDALHKNIHMVRHPWLFPMSWSHHQKTAIIDDKYAFVGGLDICFGRYEEDNYPLLDPGRGEKEIEYQKFPGRDYTNYSANPDAYGEPSIDVINRQEGQRMPWQDIHMRVDGAAARDVAYNFIQRWNYAIASQQWSISAFQAASSLYSSLVSSKTKDPPYLNPSTEPLAPGKGTCECQVLRSSTMWSTGIPTEQSIYKAYVSTIKHAEHFIYIENQYFISGTNDEDVNPVNKIAKALIERILEAIQKKETFRVIVVVPVYPGGDFKDATTRYLIQQTFKVISRGGNSIIEQIKAKFPNVDPYNYISVFVLRNWAVLKGKLITNPIYVHSKMMIVDDKRVIIGSANINDRSMLGLRDSEIAVITQDRVTVDSFMNGKPYKAAKFAFELRKKIWRDILKIDESVNIDDPTHEKTYRGIWLATAINNSEIYKKVFPSLPDNILSFDQAGNISLDPTSTKTSDELATTHQSTLKFDHTYDEEKYRLEELKYFKDQSLAKVRGYLTLYPMNFLRDQDLSVGYTDKEFLIPQEVFI